VKTYPGINYEQRPASYWADENPLAALLRNVKGSKRREIIRAYWEQGRVEELSEVLLRDKLSESERERLGKMHPSFMGGEYLPDSGHDEVEIARIELNSTLSDVICIRAKRQAKRVAYRIVDEYETEFELPRKSSRQPLSLKELVAFIDGSGHPDIGVGLALCYNQMNTADGCREDYRDFTRVSSEFYPQLADHYELVYDGWVIDGETLDAPDSVEQEKGEEPDARS
jgi:hypothetical protein